MSPERIIVQIECNNEQEHTWLVPTEPGSALRLLLFPFWTFGCCFCMSQTSTTLCSFAIVSSLDQSHRTIWQSGSVTNEASNSGLKVCKLKCDLQSVVRVWDWKAFTTIPSANCISHACASCLYADMIYEDTWIYVCIQAGFSGDSVVKNPPTNAGDIGLIPGSGRPPEKKMASHFSILAWKILWTEEPGRQQSLGSQSQTWLSN